MKRSDLVLAFGMLSIFLISGCSKELKGDLIIKNITVIDVKEGSVHHSMDIVIIKDRITSIVPNRKNTTYFTNELIDGTSKYVMPGLWDMHTHTWWAYEEFFPLLMVNGITGIKEMWGDSEAIRKIRSKIDSGLVVGPDIISSGAIVDGKPPLWKGSSAAHASTPPKHWYPCNPIT